MPGYLTHLHVLIETEKWLSELVRKLKALPNPGNLEKEMLRLASHARSFLRWDPGLAGPIQSPQSSSVPPSSQPAPPQAWQPPSTALPPPAAPAVIDNQGIGNALSKYACVGSIGPDFPAASYILAINQKWV